MKTDDEVMALKVEREGSQGVLKAQMRKVMTAANGDNVIVLPDLNKASKPGIANLVKQALDEMSMRLAGTDPNMDWPALRPHIKASQDLATQRKLAVMGWWQMNSLSKKMYRRARHLQGYGESPVAWRWDARRGIPTFDVRNPLTTLPAPTPDADDLCPEDTIFVYPKPLGWLQRCYPEAYALVKSPQSKLSDLIDVVEYDSYEETILLAAGRPSYQDAWYGAVVVPAPKVVRLEQYPNLINRPNVVVPHRITLDRLQGAFDGILPLYDQAAYMAALQLVAADRGVFPDMVVEQYPNSNTAPILNNGGPWKDGRSGEINILSGGSVKDFPIQPSQFATQAVDRLQEAMMTEGRIPSEFGGQSPTNVRTNARGVAVTSATIDASLSEAHEIFEDSLEEENKIAVALAKAYAGNTPKSFYVQGKGANKQVDYTPNTTFETDNNTVSYPMQGTDAQNLVIGIESRVGAGLMSKKTGRFLDPLIADPDGEEYNVDLELLRQMGSQLLGQQIQQGTLTVEAYLATVNAFKKNGAVIEDAIAEAHKVMQAAQAQQAQQPPQPTDAQGQPGLNPNAGAPVQPPAAGTQNVAQLLGALRGQQGG
ncbi:MAG: hypothetical protein WB777_14200 [Mycobacterium sp.]